MRTEEAKEEGRAIIPRAELVKQYSETI